MRIVLTVHQFLPEFFSGTEVLTHSVAKELQVRGHKVTVFTGYPARELIPDAKRFDRYEIDGIQVRRFHHAFVPMGLQEVVSEIEYNNHLTARYFKGLLEEVRPDVVHFFHFSRLGSALVDVVREINVAAYYTPTDFWAVCPTSQLLLPNGCICKGPSSQGGNCVKHVAVITQWQRCSKVARHVPDWALDAFVAVAKAGHRVNFLFRREIVALSRRKLFNISRLNALQGIVSPTQFMTDVLIRNGVKPELIQHSAYGINVDGFKEFMRAYPGKRPITIGYIGTLAPHKGCHVLLEAFGKLSNSCFRLKIYGNLNEFPDYVARLYAAAKGNDAIEFCGMFPNAQIADVLHGIDVLVVPSIWYENTPLVVYSALAAKCPVIASNFPGISEVVRDGWNGLLFKPNNADALFACLTRLNSEPALLQTLSGNCAPPKSIAVYVEELLTLYKKRDSAPKNLFAEQQRFTVYLPDSRGGYINGWAVVGTNAPMRVSLIEGDEEIGCTTQFLPRPDVRNGLRGTGVKIDEVNVGFQIFLVRAIDKSRVIIEIESRKNEKIRLPYASIYPGQVLVVDDAIFFGLDREELPQIIDE